jgi:hypothetical protein
MYKKINQELYIRTPETPITVLDFLCHLLTLLIFSMTHHELATAFKGVI